MTSIRWWYRALYSTQLQKKNKSWTDGYIYYIVASKKAVLLDEHGKFLQSIQPVNAGDLQDQRSLTMESYAVTVDGSPIEEPKFHQCEQIESKAKILPSQLCEAEHVSFIRRTLYTKDKVKKAKSWHDGYMKFSGKEKTVWFASVNISYVLGSLL